MKSGLQTINLSPEQMTEILKKTTELTKENGFGITAFGMVILFCFVFLSIFSLVFYIMLRNLIKQQTQSRLILEKDHLEEKKRRDKQEKEDRDRAYEINNKLIDTFKDSVDNNKENQEDFYNNIKNLINDHYKNTVEIMKSDKKLSIKQFDMQAKEVVKAQVFEVFDKLIEKVENNNLLNNKSANCGDPYGWYTSEIWQIFEEHLKYGSDKIDVLGYSEETLPNKLYLEVLKHAEDAAKKCIEVFRVENENYKDKGLTRSLRNIRKECLNKLMILKLNEL